MDIYDFLLEAYDDLEDFMDFWEEASEKDPDEFPLELGYEAWLLHYMEWRRLAASEINEEGPE